MRKILTHRLTRASILLALLIGSGIVGFILVEDYTVIDALYMTVITMSTVGFGEVKELSPQGRLFTVVFIILTLGVFTYVLSLVSSYILEVDLLRQYRERSLRRGIEKLQDHIIICGYGRTGQEVAAVLNANRIPLVIIEDAKEMVELMRQHERLYISRDATEDDCLKEAGIERARAIITTLPRDADNVFVTLTAAGLKPGIEIISRATEVNSVSKLKRAGAANVILPYKIGGVHMATLIMNPNVKEFIDILANQSHSSARVEEIHLEGPYASNFRGRPINKVDLRKRTGINILGVKANGSYIVNPPIDYMLGEEDILIVLGTHEQFLKLYDLLEGKG